MSQVLDNSRADPVLIVGSGRLMIDNPLSPSPWNKMAALAKAEV